jgi:hypothetical protein
MSVTLEKKEARQGTEYYAFDSFIVHTATELIWKVRSVKSGELGCKSLAKR